MRHLIKLFGIGLFVALGTFATTAADAQAAHEVHANGKVLTGAVTFSATSATTNSLLVSGQPSLKTQCTSTKATASGTNGGSSVTGTLLVLFHGCTLPSMPNCNLYPTEADMVNKTNKGLIHATANTVLGVLSGGSLFAVATGLGEEKSFTIVYIGEEEGCTWEFLGLNIRGQVALKLLNGTELSALHKVVDATSAEEEELGLEGLFYEEEPVELDIGEASTVLTGTHAGMPWKLN